MPQRGVLDPPEQRVSVLNGYLYKMKRNQNKYSMSAWTKRWFSIEGDKLLWYSKKGAREPSNFISLTAITTIKEFEAGRDGIFSFQVKSAERNFFLRTKSESDLDRWIRALKMHRDLWQKQSKEKKSKFKKKMTQADYKSLEVDKISASFDALARKVILDQEKKNRAECLRTSTTSSQGSQNSSRRNSFTSNTSSSSSSLEEHRPAATKTQQAETKPPSSRGRENPYSSLRENHPRELRESPPREFRESPREFRDQSPRDPYRESPARRDADGSYQRRGSRSDNTRYTGSPRTSWSRETYRETDAVDSYNHSSRSQSPGQNTPIVRRRSRGNDVSYNQSQNHSGRSRSPMEDDMSYENSFENSGSRYNSRNTDYDKPQTCSTSKPKMRPAMVDTRNEDHFSMNSPGTPVSKCWGETPAVATHHPVNSRSASTKFSQPEVDDSFGDCGDPTFEKTPSFGRPGLAQVAKSSNWVDEMWDSDEE